MMLKENPFYILDVSLSADRKKIAESADEIGFLLGEEKSREAQSILTNPSKRLNAEMAWFPEANDSDIISIRNSISGDLPISTAELTGYSKLNALVYNLGITNYTGTYELGFDIVAIDEQYNSIDISLLTKTINQARGAAGMATVSEGEVQESHRRVIEDIRKLINEKLKPYDDQAYIDFVTVIGEQYVADKRHNAGPVLFDILDQYEIRMQSEIDTKADQIIQYVDLIKSEQDNDIIRKSIPKVIGRVQEWDKYAQPLQCRSQATGLPHQISSKLAYEIRGLILYLNNEKHLTTEAKDLASAMKAVFVELGELKEVFTNDTDKLKEIENDSRNAEIINDIQKDFNSIDDVEKKLYWSGLEPRELKDFVALITSIDKKIRNSKLDKATRETLRTALCYRARKTAVDIHNLKHNPMVAKYLTCVLTDLFKDIDEPREKLQGDVLALNKNATATSVTMDNYLTFFDKYIGPKAMAERQRKWKIIKRVVIAAAILIFAIAAINNSNNKKSGSSYRSSGSSYGTSSTKSTSKPTAKPTAQPTKKPESAYSSSSNVNDSVYLDIVSIQPRQGIYSQGNTYYDYFVCECTTKSGSIVWGAFPAFEYTTGIDVTVSYRRSAYDSAKKVDFNPAARIHGTVTYSSNIMTGLSSSIGSTTLIKIESIKIPDQGITLTSDNVKDYFNFYINGELSSNKKIYVASYSIQPKSKEYAGRKKSSSEIIVKLKLEVYKKKGDKTPLTTKGYTVTLKKSKGYVASNYLEMSLKKKQSSVYFKWSVVSVDGFLGQ